MWKNLVYFGSVFFVFNLTFCPVDIFPWVPVIKHHMRSCEKMITSWGYTSSLFELKTELFLCETSVPQDEFLTVSLNDLLCAYLRKPEFHTYCILEGIAKGTSKCWTKRLKMCYFFFWNFLFFLRWDQPITWMNVHSYWVHPCSRSHGFGALCYLFSMGTNALKKKKSLFLSFTFIKIRTKFRCLLSYLYEQTLLWVSDTEIVPSFTATH